MISPEDLWKHIQQHHRIHGALPKLRECVEHFDGKLLNVLMCFGELGAARKDELRRIATQDRGNRRGRNRK
jgi:hypothetical protein